MPLDYLSGDLSEFVVPSHYHLELAPRGLMCPGRVNIDVDIQHGFTGHVIPIHAAPTVGILRATLKYHDASTEVRPFTDKPCNEPKTKF